MGSSWPPSFQFSGRRLLKKISTMADEELLTQEEMDAIGLQADQVQVLKKCFDGFADEEGAIPADQVGGILAMMGMKAVLVCWSLASSVNWPQSSLSRKMRRP